MMAPAVMISVADLEAVPRMAEELGAAPAVAPAAKHGVRAFARAVMSQEAEEEGGGAAKS